MLPDLLARTWDIEELCEITKLCTNVQRSSDVPSPRVRWVERDKLPERFDFSKSTNQKLLNFKIRYLPAFCKGLLRTTGEGRGDSCSAAKASSRSSDLTAAKKLYLKTIQENDHVLLDSMQYFTP